MFYKVNRKTIKDEIMGGDVIMPDIPDGIDFEAIDMDSYFVVRVKQQFVGEELTFDKVLKINERAIIWAK